MARKRRLNWGPILWVATIVNVIAGLALSPVTSASKVRVVGAYPTDMARLTTAIQGFRAKPALRGDGDRALEEVYRRPDVRTVQWSQNLFRRGLMTITYDRPVAAIRSMPTTILTSRGQIAQTREDIQDLPQVALFSAALQPVATVGFPFEPQKIADVCSRAATLSIDKLWISVQENGAVCLNSGDTGRVTFGLPDDLDGKFEKLQEILVSQPGILSQNKEIVLLASSKPAVRPLSSP